MFLQIKAEDIFGNEATYTAPKGQSLEFSIRILIRDGWQPLAWRYSTEETWQPIPCFAGVR